MRYFIFSDIHGNWEALRAVVDASAGKYDQAVCLGDLVGYGADPNPVVDWARNNAAVVIRGNHDRACCGSEDLEWFNPVARVAAEWTERQLTPENRIYIQELQKGPIAVDGFQLMHGSPLDEDEYMVAVAEAGAVFAYLEAPLAFFGHTHLQGGFEYCGNRVRAIARTRARKQDEIPLQLDPDCAYLLNPGSVGQPRDGDPRAAYLLYDTEDRCVVFHRVIYDVPAAQAKIVNAGLPDLLAARLSLGR